MVAKIFVSHNLHNTCAQMNKKLQTTIFHTHIKKQGNTKNCSKIASSSVESYYPTYLFFQSKTIFFPKDFSLPKIPTSLFLHSKTLPFFFSFSSPLSKPPYFPTQ
ncbi:hypothetical protein ACE6H2_010929 [Prunus campanulata]